MAPRPNWSRPLPQPLIIPDVMTLVTLADVRALVEKHLPAERRKQQTWRVVVKDLENAARGRDPVELSIALHMALSLEGVKCRTG
jgi:hypothetical protein